MTPIAPMVTDFIRVHLSKERELSPNTIDTYAHGLRLFFNFGSDRLKKNPSSLQVEDLTVELVLEFLSSIENERKNGASTRNARLAAIKTFIRYVEFKKPSAYEQARKIGGLPLKRHDQPLIKHLTMAEIQPILNAPNLTTRLGIRDRAMIHLCFACALRVSELMELSLENVNLSRSPNIFVHGKGRRERSLPLWKNVAIDIRAWLSVRGDVRATELFVNADGTAMTRSGFEYVLDKHREIASSTYDGLRGMKITPHQLRHSCAVLMLQATRDIRKVALWLGHADIRTTEIYLRMDPTEKLEAVEAVVPPNLRRGRFQAPDALIASLQRL